MYSSNKILFMACLISNSEEKLVAAMFTTATRVG
jgi:hypothetical protein